MYYYHIMMDEMTIITTTTVKKRKMSLHNKPPTKLTLLPHSGIIISCQWLSQGGLGPGFPPLGTYMDSVFLYLPWTAVL